MGRFVIIKEEKGIKFVLIATNGRLIAESDVYERLGGAMKGIAAVMRYADEAPIEDQTQEDFEILKNPKFIMYLDDDQLTRFCLKARNGKPLLQSKGYQSKRNCRNGIRSVKANVFDSSVASEVVTQWEEK